MAKLFFDIRSNIRFILHNLCTKSCFWKEIWPPFVHLINSIASRNVWKLLNLSYGQKVVKTFFKNAIYFVNKSQVETCKYNSKVAAVFSKKHRTFGRFRSCEYHIHIQLDLLYLLVGSNLENVEFLTFTRILVPM